MRLAPIRLSCVLLAVWLAGCASTRWEKETHRVRIATTPPGAKVWYEDDSGQHLVGESPVEIEREVKVRYWDFNPWWWAVAAGTAGAFAGTTYWATVAPETNDTQQGASIGLSVTTGIAAFVAILGATIGQLNDGDVQRVESFALDVGADKPGYKGSGIRIEFPPKREEVSLLLHRTEDPNEVGRFKVAGVIGKLESEKTQPPVVAVFDIHDAVGRLGKKDLDQLTDYLATCLAEAHKARVVPREQLRQRLQQTKAGSYEPCFEESCQIELGKAVAAEKSLSTTLMRIGKKCAVTVNLYDLKSETAERGATQEGGCDLDALMGSIKGVAAKL